MDGKRFQLELPSVESLLGKHFSDGASEPMPKRSSTTTAAAPKGAPALVAGAFIADAIATQWIGTDKALAEAAGISTSSLADMKAAGIKPKARNFRKLCLALKIDVRAAAKGRIVPIGEVSSERRQDLHAMLDRLVGTENEPAIERVMRGLLQVKD